MSENKKKKVYFDYNVFVNYINSSEVKSEVEKKQDTYIYVSSPAFLEEVANIKGGEELITTYITKISELYNNTILIPTVDAGIILKEEHPQQCYNRVMKDYIWTKIASKLSHRFLAQKPQFKNIREEFGISTIEINNIAPENLFNDYRIKDFIEKNPRLTNISFLKEINRLNG